MALHLIGGTNSAAGVTIVLNDALSIGANALTCGALSATTVAASGLLSPAAGITLTGTLTMATAVSILVPGATSFAVRNNANNADNLILTDAGAATFRSTVTLGANALTCGAINSQTISAAANFTGDVTIADQLIVSGAGPHVIGGAVNANVSFFLRGSFTANAATAEGFDIYQTISAGADGGSLYGTHCEATLVERGAGNHPLLATLRVDAPAVTAGGATVTDAVSLYINAAPSAVVTGSNYALWVDAGTSRLDGDLVLNAISATAVSAGAADSAGAGFRWLRVPN